MTVASGFKDFSILPLSESVLAGVDVESTLDHKRGPQACVCTVYAPRVLS